jgi:hypothetical protein
MAKKTDGVIEAVHYKNGQIVHVRAYERRGSAFGDLLMIDRKDLLERLKSGKKFVTGMRKKLMAGSFEEGPAVQVVTRAGRDFIATRADADRDDLAPAPVI